MTKCIADFVVVGGGIIGITIARELKLRNPTRKIIVLEKEKTIGLHSSGRNSGVLHSGIYYPANTLKGRLCTQGASLMTEYCESRKIPIAKIGKILVPIKKEDVSQLEILFNRAQVNKIVAEYLNESDLQELEPQVTTKFGKALFVPQTSVLNSKEVLKTIADETCSLGVSFFYSGAIKKISSNQNKIQWIEESIHYGHLINAAGLHADSLAHRFSVGSNYTLLPFKGSYWKLDPASGIRLRHLVYPVPDLSIPFLGIHTTTNMDGETYLGPNAIPAMGRENYEGLQGVTLSEFMRIGFLLFSQFSLNRDGFRHLAYLESSRYFKSKFAKDAQALIPKINVEHLLPCKKVGIRAQMLNKKTNRLVHDFIIESGKNSTHVLNAISPAFTSSLSFAKFICDQYIEKNTLEDYYAI